MAGRPREFDRTAALKCAQDVFWAHGFDGTAMSDLVEATGLASARLYAAFGSKEDLFKAAVELYRTDEGAFADRALADDGDLRTTLYRLLRDAVQTYTKPTRRGCMVVSAAMACTPEHQGVREWLEGHRRARRASIVDRVTAEAAAGRLSRAAEAQAIGDYFATVLDGLSVQARDGVPRRRLLAAVDVALSVLPDGMEAGPARASGAGSLRS